MNIGLQWFFQFALVCRDMSRFQSLFKEARSQQISFLFHCHYFEIRAQTICWLFYLTYRKPASWITLLRFSSSCCCVSRILIHVRARRRGRFHSKPCGQRRERLPVYICMLSRVNDAMETNHFIIHFWKVSRNWLIKITFNIYLVTRK